MADFAACTSDNPLVLIVTFGVGCILPSAFSLPLMLLILEEALSFTLTVIVLFFSFFKALTIFLMTEEALPFALIETLLDFNFLRDLEMEEIVFFAFPLTLIEMLLDFMLDKDFLIESIVFLAFPLAFTVTVVVSDLLEVVSDLLCLLLLPLEALDCLGAVYAPCPV